jgi:neogenin
MTDNKFIFSGDYQCRASNVVDSSDKSARLTVIVPPKFIYKPTDIKANEKDEVEINCSIYAKPPVVINWYVFFN